LDTIWAEKKSVDRGDRMEAEEGPMDLVKWRRWKRWK